MYSAKNELDKKGFIVINAFGGQSFRGRKLPSLYGLTYYSMNELPPNDLYASLSITRLGIPENLPLFLCLFLPMVSSAISDY